MQRGKFQNAEQIWFWFVYSKGMRGRCIRGFGNTAQRPCELLDVEMMVTKLYLAGRLNDKHLTTMKKYGDRRRAPNPNDWSERRDAELWTTAMQILGNAAIRAGWIEQNGGAL